MKNITVVIALILLCYTSVFADSLECHIKLNQNMKGWKTEYLEFKDDVYITEICAVEISRFYFYKVVFSNGYTQYFYNGSIIYDPDGHIWKALYFPDMVNELCFTLDSSNNEDNE